MSRVEFKSGVHPQLSAVFAFPNGNVAVTNRRGEQMTEFQRDIFLSAVKLSKYDLSGCEVQAHTDLFYRMYRRAQEMRAIGFNFDWADEL